jgi:hypothetical protein
MGQQQLQEELLVAICKKGQDHEQEEVEIWSLDGERGEGMGCGAYVGTPD